MKNLDELYRFLFNKLVEISNAEVFTIRYLIGPKWKVCNASDTVVIARNTINYFFQILNDVKNFDKDKVIEEKISNMIRTLVEIANTKPDKWDDGLFDVKYYYYAEDTVYKAQKCLKILAEYI
jgi:hypothetical protein